MKGRLPFRKGKIIGRLLEMGIKREEGEGKYHILLEVLEEAKVISNPPTKYETYRVIEIELDCNQKLELYCPLREPCYELILGNLTDEEKRTFRDALLENAKKAIRIEFAFKDGKDGNGNRGENNRTGILRVKKDDFLSALLNAAGDEYCDFDISIEELAIFEKPDSTW